ncbi:endonuclease domain-containing protein [Micromonospora mirobrigensis]|uniref:Transcriptional regulator, AbiEi antitoxin, Type IV TA system n=1 Tax=Micromonospora mirobrigensis TaxID=262898 RepID=A0A1C4ZR27_9ACTN|nr:hypothetical protein [Micromonospora mirobrigensis]SCF35490.1 hypothetical protein GA0070564_106212 [Micromonospora mirobrigensis]
MPPVAHRPADLTGQVFRGSDVVRRGLLTVHQLRSSAWTRLHHDVYADARLERDHGLACRAVALRLPPGVPIAGPSAAFLHGVEHAAGFDDEVHVSAAHGSPLRSRRGLRVHTSLLQPPLVLAGATRVLVAAAPSVDQAPPSPVAPGPALPAPARSEPALAAWETAAWLEPVRAVSIVDSLLARGLTSRGGLADAAEENADRPGASRARWVFDLADPGARSPGESRLRVRLVLAGLPRPVARHPVRLPAGIVLHPDLAWPELRVAVDYDRPWHSDLDQLHRDRQRLDLLVGAGWLVLPVTSRRLRQDFPAVVQEVRAALLSRGWRP